MDLYNSLFSSFSSQNSYMEFLIVRLDFNSETFIANSVTYKFTEAFICQAIYSYTDLFLSGFNAIAIRIDDQILVLDKLN